MSKQLRPLYCHVCDRWVSPNAFSFRPPSVVPYCPHCHGLLLPEPGNPDSLLPLGFTLLFIKAVAALLLRAGVLDHLEAKACESDTALDDFALKLARVVLEHVAQL